MDIFRELERLALPFGQYVVIGGGCLAAHGLRETRDLDILVTQELFEQLRREGWEDDPVYTEKWKRVRLKRGEVEVYPDMVKGVGERMDANALIASAESIRGFSFLPLARLLPFKEVSDREKDREDVRLIRGALGMG